MSDIVKIREWVDSDEPEPKDGWEWPAPPSCVESRVEGALRAAILVRLGRPSDDPCEIRIVESEIESGWSEFTVETDYSIEVWVHSDRQEQRVFEGNTYSNDRMMAAFFEWAGVQEVVRS